MIKMHRLLELAFLVPLVLCWAGLTGASPPIPGTYQAEDYDVGGEGFAYHDTTPGNSGGYYRVDDVDISDNGVGGYHVGQTDDGEWLRYTVNAGSNFLCRVRYRSASAAAGPFQVRLQVDGDTRDVALLGGTGGETDWVDTLSSRAFPMTAGSHTIRVTFVTGGVNLDEVEFLADTNAVPLYLDPSQPTSNRVSDLLSRMSVDEKVGQMSLVDRRFLTDRGADNVPHQESDIRDFNLGGIFSGGGSFPTPNTAEAWADMVDRFQAYALQTPNHIPVLYGSDAVHGHNNLYGSTIFPHAIGLGAAGDADLVTRLAAVSAREMAATGVRWTFAPSVSVPRNDFWGRVYEGYAETPDIVSALGAAAIQGYQGNDLAASSTVLATAKHYAGDGGTEGGVDKGNVVLGTNDFFELHVAPYEAAVTAGCMAVMASYNSWNGARMHSHTNLLTDVLKGDMGFEGFILSDWAGIDQLGPNGDGFNGYYLNILKGVNAGLDMIMIPDRYNYFQTRAEYAVSSAGDISMARLDDAVGRILTAKFKLGLFEDPYAERSLLDDVGSPEHRVVAREAVSRSMVVLKNDGELLPLPKDLARVHVAGGHADNLGYQCGGWTIEWQGGSGNTTIGTTILEAISNTVSAGTTVTYSSDGTGAAGADVAVVVVGETPYAEFLGDTQNLGLRAVDLTSIQNVQAAEVPVIVVLISGRPLMVESHLPDWDALVAAWLPGTEGQGIADVLFGDYYPSSVLTYSWPRTTAQVPINIGDATYDPLFAYAFGLFLNPILSVVEQDAGLVFSWPANHVGFQVEEAATLTGSPIWTPVPGSPGELGGAWVLTNATPAGPFAVHRLRRP